MSKSEQYWGIVSLLLKEELKADENKYNKFLEIEKKMKIVNDDDKPNIINIIFNDMAVKTEFIYHFFSKCMDIIKEKLPYEIYLDIKFEDGKEENILKETKKDVENDFLSFYPENKQVENEIKTEENSKIKFLNRLSECNLNVDYDLSNFVRGDNSLFAVAISERIIQNEKDLKEGKTDKIENNPFLIFGNPGHGKTHLAQAIGIELLKYNPEINICYTTTESYIDEYISNLQGGDYHQIRNKYRNLDVFILDDIQFLEQITGKGKSQEEFFHTFNTLLNNGKRIILVSDKNPALLSNFSDRLKSRLQGGVDVEIEASNITTRIGILRNFAKRDNILVTPNVDEALKYVAEKIPSDIRILKGAYDKIKSYSSFKNDEINIKYAQEILAGIEKDEKDRITANKIIEEIVIFYNIDKEKLLNGKKEKEKQEALKMVMYLLKEILNISYQEIARLTNKKTHSTVVKSNQAFSDEINENRELRLKYEKIKEKLSKR